MMESLNKCQICQESKSVKTVSELRQNVIKYVLANVDYNEELLICCKCFETIEKLYDFKSMCLELESNVESMFGVGGDEAQLQIEDIIGIGVKNEEFVCNSRICRICFEIQNYSASIISIAEPNARLMVNKCLPELNLDAIKDPVSCEKCFHLLEQYLSMLQCVNEKIKCEAVNDEEFAVFDDDFKQEELEIKFEKQESNMNRYRDDNFDNVYTSLSTKELYENESHYEFLLDRKQLTHVERRLHDKGDVCYKEITQKSNLIDLRKSHRGGKHFKCDICDKGFGQKRYLITHMRMHTGDRPYKCDVCDKRFKQRTNLTYHSRRHTGEKPFKCNICGKGFTQKSHLIDHTRTHTSEKLFKCDICDKGFGQKSYLIRHTRRHEKLFNCDICKKGFGRKSDLMKHMRIHTRRPFKCDICDKRFSQKDYLVIHMRVHTDEKPFKCDICDKGFSLKGNLICHMGVHTGNRPFKCDVCDKRFRQKSYLVIHIRLHTDGKPFKCDICGKGFGRKSHLIGHIRSHTREKPFKCDICSKWFGQKSNLVGHTRTHKCEQHFKDDM